MNRQEEEAIQDDKEKQENLRPKHSKAELSNPKHKMAESPKPKHSKPKSPKRMILRAVVMAELIAVVLACGYIYRIWYHGIEVHAFAQVWSAGLEGSSASMSDGTHNAAKTYLEAVGEEVYEYVWTAAKVKYRKGADDSYKSAGTLEKDKMVRRTGITHNGWSRIVVDDKEYYIPGDKVSTDIPDSLPIADGIKGEYQKYALSLLPEFGWDSSELEPLIYLWNRESGWNPNSHNKKSGAHGIPQALPGSKMASEGSDYYTNAEPQIRWGLKYIAGRYGSPSAAWAHWQSRGWY